MVRDISLLKDDVITEGRSAPWGTLGLLEVDFPQLEWKNTFLHQCRSKSETYIPKTNPRAKDPSLGRVTTPISSRISAPSNRKAAQFPNSLLFPFIPCSCHLSF
jgi:hypothetical protein